MKPLARTPGSRSSRAAASVTLLLAAVAHTAAAAGDEATPPDHARAMARGLEAFKKDYPDIKVVSVTGTGNQLGTRIVTERRAEKYIPDVFSTGPNSAFNILYKAKVLDPLRAACKCCSAASSMRSSSRTWSS